MVPEALLAAAKDARYLHECQILIQQVLEAFGRSDEHMATAVSSILYSLLVILPRGRTLGMEVTGLQFDQRHYPWVALAVACSLLVYALHREDENDDSAESLRGSSRREFFLRQREAMRNRSRDTSSSTTTTTITREATDNSTRSSQPSRIQACLRTICNGTEPEGPHFVESNVQQRSWLQWLLRLHLAFYCVHGRYASWMHRLLRISYQQSEADRLVTRPTSYRAVGLFILSHAAGTALLSVSRNWMRRWFDFCKSKTRNTALVNSPPSIPSASTCSSFTCGICHANRTYPACPVDCGHVFCWSCIQKWVQTVRPECPLCRTPCSAADVIPLYNYDPSE